MTPMDIARVETQLNVHLPQDYREVLLNGAELQSLTHVLGGVVCPFFEFSLFLNADESISVNKWERNPEAATEYVFPGWWREYFIIGTNGGGDYFCVRLDGSQGVWFLCNDNGEVTRENSSVGVYASIRLQEYQRSKSDGPGG
ncbi:MAG TPA: SMI1/KNR4 family protein [Gemmataceae bacterium]|nr:SMI1/KNR4 family protein [Gemmataceae bacterium]